MIRKGGKNKTKAEPVSVQNILNDIKKNETEKNRQRAAVDADKNIDEDKRVGADEKVDAAEAAQLAKLNQLAELEETDQSEKDMTKAKQKTQRKQASKKPLSKKRIIISAIAGVVFSALLVFAGLKIYQWRMDDIHTEEQQEETADIAEGHEVEAEGELINPPEDKQNDYWYFIGLPFYEVNFSELQARNSDTIGFIHMNNNNVNYPVVQSGDNDYYLHHAFDGSYNDAGWVFMDYRSSLNPPSQNTVIYGHGRYNGTVFGSLQSVLTPQWQANRDNHAIWLSTPTENLMYQIFSIYTIEAESYYIRQNFTPDEWATWVETMASRNMSSINTSVLPSDQILTLSTCKDDNNNRIVIHAKLIKRQAR